MTMTEGFAADSERVFDRMPIGLGSDESLAGLIENVVHAERHLLSVNDEGDYTLTHMIGEAPHPAQRCSAVQVALGAFISLVDADGNTIAHRVDPGFYWCSVSEDGVFEIGSRAA